MAAPSAFYIQAPAPTPSTPDTLHPCDPSDNEMMTEDGPPGIFDAPPPGGYPNQSNTLNSDESGRDTQGHRRPADSGRRERSYTVRRDRSRHRSMPSVSPRRERVSGARHTRSPLRRGDRHRQRSPSPRPRNDGAGSGHRRTRDTLATTVARGRGESDRLSTRPPVRRSESPDRRDGAGSGHS